ncbi:hypothetical protein DAPPUDRAFT_334620 [Daphnia pulex]|uniref:Methuselah N-terminal domain-containing protein n=1 Tax=Daphnia pulex TaxID=6669 RepID=E9HVZ8_DAPPU|nr:hypothetical protein DAPPUDRAFT_334620 [Daphnia pulex]|eukprot:EFX64074.1 hypothetical protein DAPPUDRAFT_334620 [Daphnia pulex]
MEIFQRAFIILAFILYFQLMATASPPQSNTKFPSSANNSKEKFLIRKCCGPGQVYNFNWEEDVADRRDRCVKYSITSSHPSSQNYSRPVFFGSEQTVPSQYAIEDVEIDAGFPSNCTPDRYGSTLILLEPDMRMADLFYPIASGQLIVPHRFWVLQNEHHCIEDFFLDGNIKKARRVAFICTSHTHPFPTSAIDDFGKLQMNFIRWTAPAELSAFAGKTVVRKCCDRNEVYSQNLICIENNRGASTQFFDELQFAKSDELFFRFGLPICSDPFLYRRQTIDFVLNSNGSLEINSGSNLVSIENYCMEDIVYKDSVGLPVTSNLAIFCSDQKMEELPKKEEVAPAEKPTIIETVSEMVVRNESTSQKSIFLKLSGSFKVSNEMLFIPYSAFGWGFPVLSIIAALVTQFQSSQIGISEMFNPNMGLLKCWFADGTSALVFFYAPVGSLLIFDIVCFLTLLFNPNLMHCWRGKQGMAMRTNRNASKDSKEQQE